MSEQPASPLQHAADCLSAAATAAADLRPADAAAHCQAAMRVLNVITSGESQHDFSAACLASVSPDARGLILRAFSAAAASAEGLSAAETDRRATAAAAAAGKGFLELSADDYRAALFRRQYVFSELLTPAALSYAADLERILDAPAESVIEIALHDLLRAVSLPGD